MAEMPAAFEWEEVVRIDPLNLQEYEKDHLDEIIGMFLSVTVHSSHHLAVSNTYCQLHHIYFLYTASTQE